MGSKISSHKGLLKKLLPMVTSKTIIEGGHYLLEEDRRGKIIHKLNPVSALAFKEAVMLYAESIRLGEEVSFCFLVADLSLSSQNRKQCKENFAFPAEYVHILAEHGVSVDEVLLFYESKLRNRAGNRIISGLKRGSVMKQDDCCFVSTPDACSTEYLLSNVVFDKHPVPNCRMLLSQELQDKELLGFTKAINLCNSDVYKCKGTYAEVYHSLLDGKMDVVNVYFTMDSSGIIYVEIKLFLQNNAKV